MIKKLRNNWADFIETMSFIFFWIPLAFIAAIALRIFMRSKYLFAGVFEYDLLDDEFP